MSKPGFKHSLMRCALAALFVSPSVMAQSPFSFVITGDTQYARTTAGDCGTSNSSSDNVCKSDANYMVDSFTHAVNHIPEDYPGSRLSSLWVNGSQTAHGTQSELNFVSSAWTQGVKVFLPHVFFGAGSRDVTNGSSTITNWVAGQFGALKSHPDNGNNVYLATQDQADNLYSVNLGRIHVVQMMDIKTLNADKQQALLSALSADLQIARQAGQMIVVMLNDSTNGSGMASLADLLRRYEVSAVFAGNDENEVGQIIRDGDGDLWHDLNKFQIGSVVAGTGLMVNVDPEREFMTVSALQVQATGGTYSLEKVGDYTLTGGPNTLPYRVDFFSGNNQGGTKRCSVSDNPGLSFSFDIKDSTAPCKNDDIRSGMIMNAAAGSEITVFDSPSFSTSDDNTVIHIKKDLPFPLPLNTFEQSFENEYVKVELHYKNGLDGKISSITGKLPTRPDLVQYDFNFYTRNNWWGYSYDGVGGGIDTLACHFNASVSGEAISFNSAGSPCYGATVNGGVLQRMPANSMATFIQGPIRFGPGPILTTTSGAQSIGVGDFFVTAHGTPVSWTGNLTVGYNGTPPDQPPASSNGFSYWGFPATQRDVSLDGAGSGCNFWMHQRYFASDFKTDSAGICQNGVARTVTVRSAEAGDTLVLYDNPNQDKSYDYTKVYFKQPLRAERQLTDLDNDYEDDQLRITHVGDHAMDGVDSIEIYNHPMTSQDELADVSMRDLPSGQGDAPIDCDGTSQSFDNGAAPSGFAQRNAPARVNVGRPQCHAAQPAQSTTPVLKLYTGNGAASASSVPACVVPITGALQEGALGSGEFASCPTSNIASARIENAKAGERISFFPTALAKQGSAMGSGYTSMLIQKDLTAPAVIDSLNASVDVEAFSADHFGKPMSEIKSLSMSLH